MSQVGGVGWDVLSRGFLRIEVFHQKTACTRAMSSPNLHVAARRILVFLYFPIKSQSHLTLTHTLSLSLSLSNQNLYPSFIFFHSSPSIRESHNLYSEITHFPHFLILGSLFLSSLNFHHCFMIPT